MLRCLTRKIPSQKEEKKKEKSIKIMIYVENIN